MRKGNSGERRKMEKKRLMRIVMAGLGPLIKPILRDTFIEVLVDELNKLEHKNNDKIRDIDEKDNKVPESRRYSSTN